MSFFSAFKAALAAALSVGLSLTFLSGLGAGFALPAGGFGALLLDVAAFGLAEAAFSGFVRFRAGAFAADFADALVFFFIGIAWSGTFQ
jgi:hypothetical protein